MPAYRRFKVGLARLEALTGLEPLPVTVNQTDKSDRRVTDLHGQGNQIVKALL